tara:strand:- start:722 stop:2191 length:1470 start_codon:yes stop_codon:yes gene_type:complete
MKHEEDIQYLKWDKKLFNIFKKSCETNLKLHEAQVYQPYFSLYFNIHNTKHSHKLMDLKNKYQIEEIVSSKSHKHYTSNSFTLCKLKNNNQHSVITKELFCKCIPLLDPLYFIKNNYNNIIHRNPLLPSCYNHNTFDKINDMNNSAYIDTFFSYICSNLTQNDILPSFPIFYGSVNGIKSSFNYDISDEYYDLKYEDWFYKNIGITYSMNIYVDSDSEEGSEEESINDDSKSNLSNTTNSSYKSNKEDYIACLKNIPCQHFFIEKLEGTLEDFLDKNDVKEDLILSCIFQISFALTYLQKYYNFTHNDLHINNIMFQKTDRSYLYYKFNNIYFKIPTHGYIFKIIDFGRAIFTFHKKTFFNDTFYKHGEADGQYTLPFDKLMFSSNGKKNVKPNYNFDLCRLAITILDVFDFDKDKDYKGNQSFFNFIYNLTLDNKGESFFDLNDDFTLYKIISEEATNSLPRNIIQNYIFNQYRIKKKYFPKKLYYHL